MLYVLQEKWKFDKIEVKRGWILWGFGNMYSTIWG